jgi:hypothetical protein
METYTSMTYSIQKTNNDTTVTKIEYNSTIKDNDEMVDTYYNNSTSNDVQKESFTRTLKKKKEICQQIGISTNKTDWQIQEYVNNNCQKDYIDSYDAHNFDKYIKDCIPCLTNMNDKFLLKNE